MKYYKKLVGERIYLSPVNVEDAEKYVEWFCDFKTSVHKQANRTKLYEQSYDKIRQ